MTPTSRMLKHREESDHCEDMHAWVHEPRGALHAWVHELLAAGLMSATAPGGTTMIRHRRAWLRVSNWMPHPSLS